MLPRLFYFGSGCIGENLAEKDVKGLVARKMMATALANKEKDKKRPISRGARA